MKVFSIMFFFFLTGYIFNQINIYQDIVHGGITGAGGNIGATAGTISFDIFIPPGSTVKKAFLLAGADGEPEDISVILNSITYTFSANTIATANFLSLYSAPPTSSINYIEVTNDINPNITNYSITIPNQNYISQEAYYQFYLIVIYENIGLPKTSIEIVLNQIDVSSSISYLLTNLLPIDNNYDVGLSIVGRHFCDTIQDGSYVYVNGNEIGLVGGNDQNSSVFSCTGIRGHFYYQNNIFFGLDDDTPDNIMGGADAIANIQSYLNNNDTQLSLEFIYQNPINENGSKSNPIMAVFLSHISPCDTFSVSTTPDTTICNGENLQLYANGGQTYEWFPTTDLSCSDCPNPIFTGDSSRFYTVRIWNNDSCSVVRPIKVNVRPKPEFEIINSIPSHCGTNDGIVNLSATSETQTPITFALNDTLIQNTGTFNGLVSGIYSFSITDGFGCMSKDTIVIVGEINTTVANFTVSPTYGVVPLAVDFTNTSVNATDYLWSINGMDQGSNLSSYTFDTSGLYTIQLIAWQYDPSCADTMQLTVLAVDQLIIPTAFTPDNDGVNDRWVIPNIYTIYPNHRVYVYNRWGTLLYEVPEGKYNVYPWKGIYEDKELPVGSYYFIIDPNDGVTEAIKGIVSIIK